MPKDENLSNRNIAIDLPVLISYPVLEKFLKEKAIGEIIKKENKDGEVTRYAQILDISVAEGLPGYDFAFLIELQTLTSLFKNKKVNLIFYGCLQLNEQEQNIHLSDYKVEGKTSSWLADQFIQTVLNKWMYEKMKERMTFDLSPLIQSRLNELNEKLEGDLEPAEGISVSGSMHKLKVSNLYFEKESIRIILRIEGGTEVIINKIPQ